MCVDPVLLTIASAAVSTGGALLQGKQEQVLADYQARALEQQALADAQASAHEQRSERRRQELAAASARAQVGASGVALQGSPTEVMAAGAREGALELEAIQYSSGLRQNQLASQAAVSRFQGRQARVASYFDAADSFVSGITPLFGSKRLENAKKVAAVGGASFPKRPRS